MGRDPLNTALCLERKKDDTSRRSFEDQQVMFPEKFKEAASATPRVPRNAAANRQALCVNPNHSELLAEIYIDISRLFVSSLG